MKHRYIKCHGNHPSVYCNANKQTIQVTTRKPTTRPSLHFRTTQAQYPRSVFSDSHLNENLWDLSLSARTEILIKTTVLADKLTQYPNNVDANDILEGFRTGFKLEYSFPVFFPEISSRQSTTKKF